MKIYITGATGFVGKNLVPYLTDRGYLVNIIDRQQLENNFDDLPNDGHTVIHLAGKAHDLKQVSNSKDYYDINFDLTKKLYAHFLRSNFKKFIFISSVKAASDTVDGILTEESNPEPKTDYGKSKLMAEQYIQSQKLPAGKSYYILRPCMIHGPGNKGNLNLLYKFVQKGIPYPLASYNNKRSFLSIENLCFVINNLLKMNLESGIYNVADDEGLSTSEVVKILSYSSGRKPKLLNISKSLIKRIASIGDWLNLPLNTERLNKLTESYLVSNAKIKKAINSDLPLNVSEGIEITAKSFLNKTD